MGWTRHRKKRIWSLFNNFRISDQNIICWWKLKYFIQTLHYVRVPEKWQDLTDSLTSCGRGRTRAQVSWEQVWWFLLAALLLWRQLVHLWTVGWLLAISLPLPPSPAYLSVSLSLSHNTHTHIHTPTDFEYEDDPSVTINDGYHFSCCPLKPIPGGCDLKYTNQAIFKRLTVNEHLKNTGWFAKSTLVLGLGFCQGQIICYINGIFLALLDLSLLVCPRLLPWKEHWE